MQTKVSTHGMRQNYITLPITVFSNDFWELWNFFQGSGKVGNQIFNVTFFQLSVMPWHLE